ncbi:hypothetical protein J5A52_02705 [TM7 phylum sp. oral taxon 349]|nr:hypothetical protein J5A52_02705 [TM7 phylum sp. oral taxon 349]
MRLKRTSFMRSFTAIVAVAGGLAAAYWFGPQLLDEFRAQQYTPSSHISAIEQRVTLTSAGRRIFYATSPEVQDSGQFNGSCHSVERTTAILGCYYRDRIYLYNVQNSELDGALDVTAAHELLHAAYARLSTFEQHKVDGLVRAAYQKVKNEPTLKRLMEYYKQAEPGAEINELHSILGTTIANLDSELERYYARYFTNRASIVTLNQRYTQVFSELDQQATSLKAKISAEESSLKTETDAYQNELNQLNSDIQSFNQRAVSGDFSSQEFYATRSALSGRVASLNSQQNQLNTRISAYNTMIAEYNKLAVRAQQLNQSMNGVSAPSEVK